MDGTGLSSEEASKFVELGEERITEILAVTEQVRKKHKGDEVDLCAITSAKTGLCAEDCSFCSQSVNYATDIKSHTMVESEDIIRSAKEAEASGAREFSIVTSGTKVEKERDVEKLIGALKGMKETVEVERCASLGNLTPETMGRLKSAGLESYHHNLETSRSYFPHICTTHKYEEDVEVVRNAKKAGFYVCSGGIFGLGESWDDRIELAETLTELGVDSVPINFLNPRPGTPLEKSNNLTPRECLKIIALYRLMMPTTDIVVCGGRNVNLRDLQSMLFAAGANGMMIGNYLTTPGRSTEDDLNMLKDLGLTPKAH
ncbi:MAG: biotin synthase BioB [Proteobacteria bacterium]|nr:biotin synthase BioB [Pseudomonadota bacterium]